MSLVSVEIVDHVAVVTMNNPPANLFTIEMATAVREAVHTATSAGARAMVLRAEGKLFSGGVDVHLFKGTSPEEAQTMLAEAFSLIETVETAPFPVIAVVHGLCVAAGLELALACDLIVAAEGSQFAQVEAKIGAATFLGGVYRLAQRAGSARAFEITFSGEYFDAAAFERWNIINRVVPADQLDETAMSLARRLAAGPTAAHDVTKKLVRYAADHGLRAADRYVLDVATPLFATDDMQSAVNALLTHGSRKFVTEHSELVTFTGE